MDQPERDRFLSTLRSDESFRADVRRELLTDELLNLPQTVATLVDAIAAQRQDFTVLADAMAEQRQTVASLVDAVAGQRQDFAALAGSVRDYMERTISGISTFQTGLTIVSGEISSLRTDVAGEISSLRTDMEAGFASVDAKFDQVHAEIHDIKADIRDIKDQLAS